MEKKSEWLERVKDSFAWFSVAIAAIMLLGLFLNATILNGLRKTAKA